MSLVLSHYLPHSNSASQPLFPLPSTKVRLEYNVLYRIHALLNKVYGKNNMITTPTVLSNIFAVGTQQLTKYKAIVTRITTIEELTTITVLYSDRTGTPTTNKLTIDCPTTPSLLR